MTNDIPMDLGVFSFWIRIDRDWEVWAWDTKSDGITHQHLSHRNMNFIWPRMEIHIVGMPDE